MSATDRPSKEANPLIWGAWGAIAAGVIAVVAIFAGEALPQTVTQAAAGGFFWLWVVANIKNWLASRKP